MTRQSAEFFALSRLVRDSSVCRILRLISHCSWLVSLPNSSPYLHLFPSKYQLTAFPHFVKSVVCQSADATMSVVPAQLDGNGRLDTVTFIPWHIMISMQCALKVECQSIQTALRLLAAVSRQSPLDCCCQRLETKVARCLTSLKSYLWGVVWIVAEKEPVPTVVSLGPIRHQTLWNKTQALTRNSEKQDTNKPSKPRRCLTQ